MNKTIPRLIFSCLLLNLLFGNALAQKPPRPGTRPTPPQKPPAGPVQADDVPRWQVDFFLELEGEGHEKHGPVEEIWKVFRQYSDKLILEKRKDKISLPGGAMSTMAKYLTPEQMAEMRKGMDEYNWASWQQAATATVNNIFVEIEDQREHSVLSPGEDKSWQLETTKWNWEYFTTVQALACAKLGINSEDGSFTISIPLSAEPGAEVVKYTVEKKTTYSVKQSLPPKTEPPEMPPVLEMRTFQQNFPNIKGLIKNRTIEFRSPPGTFDLNADEWVYYLDPMKIGAPDGPFIAGIPDSKNHIQVTLQIHFKRLPKP